MTKNTSISLKAVHFAKWTLDQAQFYSSAFMLLNSVSPDLGVLAGGVCANAYGKVSNINLPGDWNAFQGYKGSLGELKITGETLYNNIKSGEGDNGSSVEFLEAAAKTGALGLAEYYTTGTHLSLSVPIALLTSGSVTQETIALPLVGMIATDLVLNSAEAYLTSDSFDSPELACA